MTNQTATDTGSGGPVATPAHPGWKLPGFRRGRTGPKVIAGITYSLLAWVAILIAGNPVALVIFLGGIGWAIARWTDYQGLGASRSGKPGRPWLSTASLALIGSLAWIGAYSQDIADTRAAQAVITATAASAQATANAFDEAMQATQTARMQATQKAIKKADQAERAAGIANRASYISLINGVARGVVQFISTIERGDSDDTAVIVLKDSWHRLRYQVRLNFAQSLLTIWRRIRSTNQSYITLTNLEGDEVGGNGVSTAMYVVK